MRPIRGHSHPFAPDDVPKLRRETAIRRWGELRVLNGDLALLGRRLATAALAIFPTAALVIFPAAALVIFPAAALVIFPAAALVIFRAHGSWRPGLARLCFLARIRGDRHLLADRRAVGVFPSWPISTRR